MLKWVRERFSVLAMHRDRDRSVGAVALAVTQRVTAISSTLLTTSNTRQSAVAHAQFSGSSMATQRRPGVHARWKEINRLPMQGSV